MAKIIKSISLLLVVMACCFVRETISTAENEREGKQILLSPAVAPFPFYYYANSPLYTGVPKSSSLEGRVSNKLLSPPDDYTNNEATSRTFFRIFGCPTCSTCPSAVVCPTCPTCPAIPAACPGTTNAADPILITINGATACTKASTGADNFGTGGCTRVTAAPTGVFTVSFTGGANAVDPYPTAFIGIVATCPNTKVTVKCGTITTAVVTTQTKAIPSGGSATETGSAIITVGRGNQAIDSVSCSWTSSV